MESAKSITKATSSKILWQKAMVDASVLKGDLRLNWEKIDSIDPCIYDFNSRYGMNLISLRLVGVELNILPPELCAKLPSLELLSLANNNLTTIPDTIVQLTNLTELSLMYNKISKLPDRIGLLCSLQKLGINNNYLEYLPITFGALNLLIRVDLECNKLSVLPENLDNMMSCKYLNLNKNQLVRLPRCLARMPSLTSLSAANNNISYIPVELLTSRSLAIIRLSNNNIRILPERFGELGNTLKELSLDFNDLRQLPMSFWKLVELKVLRIEGNLHLLDPPPEIIAKGAEGVVAYCKESFLQDKQGRMRKIIRSLQGVLYQAMDSGLSDNAHFEAHVHIDNDRGNDDWFALHMSYFWQDLLPKLERIWQANLDGNLLTGEVPNDDEINNFPFTEKEIFWAFSNFHDAYGPVFRRQEANFRRCACVDENGRRRPCVPPVVGFMCRKKCVLFKMQLVRNRDKQEREWQQYKQNGIADAIRRAEFDARHYLESADGRLWVEDTAYEQAEEILIEKGADSAVLRRQNINERRKQNIVKKYNKQIGKIQKIRDAKVSALQTEADRLNKDLKQAGEGYMRTVLTTRVKENTRSLANLVETAQIQQLQLQCEYECEKLDAQLVIEGDSSDSDVDKIIGFDVELEEAREDKEQYDSDDDSPEAVKWRKRKDLRQQMRDLRDRYKIDGVNVLATAKESDTRNVEEDDDSLITSKLVVATKKKGTAVNVIQSGIVAAGVVSKAVDTAIVKPILAPAGKTIKSTTAHVTRKTARKWTQAVDVATIRIRKLFSKMNGNFDEIQKEMKFEIYHQYIQHQIDITRQKILSDFAAIETVRDNLQGIGLVTTFRRWSRFTWNKVQRQRRDIRRDFKKATKTFEAAMESVNCAQAQVDMWLMKKDIYTDRNYWQHKLTQLITFDKPGLQHYLPPNFMIPDPPVDLPPHVSLESSSEDDDDGSDGDWEKQKMNSRRHRLASSPNKRSQQALKYAISDDSDDSTIATNEFFSPVAAGALSGNKSPAAPPMSTRSRALVLRDYSLREGNDNILVPEGLNQVSYSSDGLSAQLLKALDKAREYIKSSSTYSTLKGKEMVVAESDLGAVITDVRERQAAEYERTFRLIRKKRNQLNPIRSNTYIRQGNRRPRSLEQLIEEQRRHAKHEAAANTETIRVDGVGSIDLDTKDIDIANPTEEQLLKLAGGTLDMIRTGIKGVELRNILAQRALQIKKRLEERAVAQKLIKPKSFFQREIMPFFSNTYYSDSDESDNDNANNAAKEKFRQLKEKRKQESELKNAIVEKARLKKEALNRAVKES